MRKNQCLEAALDELAKVGILDVQHSFGGKHQQIRFRSNGSGERMYTLPCTPSDVRSVSNVRADVRRLLREDGLLTTAEHKPPPPKTPDKIALLERRIAALEERFAVLEQQKRRRWLCVDCGTDTHKLSEDYSVTNKIWADAGMRPDGGKLCIGCLEVRLGRKLYRPDFKKCPLNDGGLFPQSERLKERLIAEAVA